MNKNQKLILTIIIIVILISFFFVYNYYVGFKNWAVATRYSFSFFSILNKLTFFVFVFFSNIVFIKTL